MAQIAGQSGLFITLEGGDGAGKSVQSNALLQRLEERGVTAVLTREPGGTPLGERLRDIVLSLAGSGDSPLHPLIETFLFVAARAELVERVIAPAIARGDVVVCDRFADSTVAYQGFGRGVEAEVIERLNEIATGGLRPKLTVLLDLSVEAGLARARAAGTADRFEREAVAFHERVRAGYQTLAEREPDRWLLVDARQSPDAVAESIWRRVEPLLERRS